MDSAATTLNALDALFTTEAQERVPEADERHDKPQGNGDQRTCED